MAKETKEKAKARKEEMKIGVAKLGLKAFGTSAEDFEKAMVATLKDNGVKKVDRDIMVAVEEGIMYCLIALKHSKEDFQEISSLITIGAMSTTILLSEKYAEKKSKKK